MERPDPRSADHEFRPEHRLEQPHRRARFAELHDLIATLSLAPAVHLKPSAAARYGIHFLLIEGL